MSISIYNSSITNSGLPTEWFGFAQAITTIRQDLVMYNSPSGVYLNTTDSDSTTGSVSMILLEQGCIINGNGNKNCTHACYENPSLLWTDENATYTLYNCLVLPLVAKAYGQNILSDMVPKYNRTSESTYYEDDASGLMHRYGIVAKPDLNLTDPDQWAGINNCTKAYCQASGGVDCDNITSLTLNDNWRIGTFVPHFLVNGSLCDGVAGTINQDLGGVGMIIAYLIQITIFLTGWVIGTLNSAAIAVVHFTARFLYHSSDTSKGTRWSQAKRHQRKIRQSRQAVALNAALVEFQKRKHSSYWQYLWPPFWQSVMRHISTSHHGRICGITSASYQR
ncbi:hypothetical protein LTR78_002298 [Recurvomyces mirabilis]|uniref:Uncharacterized protein n=1 Tax=Recurvomyces mirabilis TaxID=574656 RepID=A0AAE0WUR6_9PEZI|nr:hypothetical protein LTR78_002298 [Recurvomyces mirabilis]KAK5160753.1 hypothetical protein LTS14_001766 [Recurvomyces mirabilis]